MPALDQHLTLRGHEPVAGLHFAEAETIHAIQGEIDCGFVRGVIVDQSNRKDFSQLDVHVGNRFFECDLLPSLINVFPFVLFNSRRPGGIRGRTKSRNIARCGGFLDQHLNREMRVRSRGNLIAFQSHVWVAEFLGEILELLGGQMSGVCMCRNAQHRGNGFGTEDVSLKDLEEAAALVQQQDVDLHCQESVLVHSATKGVLATKRGARIHNLKSVAGQCFGELILQSRRTAAEQIRWFTEFANRDRGAAFVLHECLDVRGQLVELQNEPILSEARTWQRREGQEHERQAISESGHLDPHVWGIGLAWPLVARDHCPVIARDNGPKLRSRRSMRLCVIDLHQSECRRLGQFPIQRPPVETARIPRLSPTSRV